MARLTAHRVRTIREKSGGFVGRVLWVTYSTLSRWELGYAVPFGSHLRILMQLEKQLARPSFEATLKDPRADDPMFLLYSHLRLLYTRRKP